jgi:hypothetical protein
VEGNRGLRGNHLRTKTILLTGGGERERGGGSERREGKEIKELLVNGANVSNG